MSEYRQKKGKRTLPSTSSCDGGGGSGASNSAGLAGRRNPFLAKPKTVSTSSGAGAADPDIAAQQKSSLASDSEAQVGDPI